MPVLLSMLVLIFASQAVGTEGVRLPRTRLELYTQAVECAVRRRCKDNDEQATTLSALKRVACVNQHGRVREFMSIDVDQALSRPQAKLWYELGSGDDGLPLVKTLTERSESEPAQYQFKHLSFQEGPFAQELCNIASSWAG